MADVDVESMRAAFEELDRIPFSFKGKCTQARLMDENDPDGAVALTDDKGVAYVMMPREVYEDILEYNKNRAKDTVEDSFTQNTKIRSEDDYDLTVHRATKQDAEDIHAFGITIPEIKVSSQVEFMSKEELEVTLENPWAVVFFACDKKGTIQGFCLGQTGDPDHCDDPTQACLVYLAVAEEWRGSSLAVKLYQDVVGELKKRGVTYLYAWACPTSGAAKFFAKQGLVPGRTCVWMDTKL
jgi:N-acetylglutamate synthase-like GNAT family acetyltransferase